jgi:EpsI family protein
MTVALLLHIAFYYLLPKNERTVAGPPLSQMPQSLGGWSTAYEGQVDPEVQQVLRADDTLVRSMDNPRFPSPASIFVATFYSQRNGQAPHSPKNCLPGSGWVPSASGVLDIEIPALSETIHVNRYLIERGDQRSLVLYWYQSRQRVIASEYAAKIYLVLDSIRYRRSDTSLVRIVIPYPKNGGRTPENAAADLARELYPALRKVLPS